MDGAASASTADCGCSPSKEAHANDAGAEPEPNSSDEKDADSDWDDWDDEEDEEDEVEAGPRYTDVGNFLWWLASRSPTQQQGAGPSAGGRYVLEAAAARLRNSDAAMLLAAMRHTAPRAARAALDQPSS